MTVAERFEAAKEQYGALGVNVDEALETLKIGRAHV